MSNTATYYLPNIDEGNIMFWSLCSQTGSTGSIVLKDDNQIYFNKTKDDSSNNLQVITTDSAIYRGGANLRLEVVLNEGCNINQIINAYNIADSSSRTLGCSYNYCLEDSTDNDFNDYYINVVAWKNIG